MEKNAGWDIVQIIGKYFNQLVQERIAASPFFGLMVDETTDISTTTQLIIYLKYLVKLDDNENGPGEYEPQVMYLDLISPESGSAIHIKVLFA
jgi:hypothetical protein